MKTAICIIAVCEVIRTIQITVDLVIGFKARRETLESINKVGDSVADDFKPDKLARAIIDEAAKGQRMKCDECPAAWAERDIMTACGVEHGEYGCYIRGREYGAEGESCYRTQAKVKSQLEELKDYACGRIKRPEWVLQRFLHDLKSQMDTVQCGLPGYPPLWQPKRDEIPFDDEYCITVKSLYGSTDMHYEQRFAYRDGYEDCKAGKAFNDYYPKYKPDDEKEADIFE